MDQIMKERVDLLEQWIRESDNVVFFGVREFPQKAEFRIFAV